MLQSSASEFAAAVTSICHFPHINFAFSLISISPSPSYQFRRRLQACVASYIIVNNNRSTLGMIGRLLAGLSNP
ncbi:hypothetical protein K457DRAFT_1735485 [Linnemannia elongata AG-77]|uniref:Uncharacterized protein n=1 Tax=Linnemannia elongata AG-77 TaxID=1314771 RepID=A0A197JH19_9FUNG|nr:hypothetical protein K457DRAFT_1735485 [Linnemannia elongata AG-77]